MTGKHHFDLTQLNLHPEAEALLGRYIADRVTGECKYSGRFRRVFHDKRLTKEQQARITSYAEALMDADVGAQ